MNYTRLTFGDKARAKVLGGATILTDAVRVTLGPRSKSVLMEKKFGTPLVCDDGVALVE
jgi:chaperonin GroEL